MPLPHRDEAFSLVDEYFRDFNQAFPLYHRATFMKLFDQHDSHGIRRESSGWWASLNIVLAIAHRIRSMITRKPQEQDPKAWGYLKNAVELLPELTLRNKDLLSVQALLGMALFLQGTPSPYPAFSLAATAIRQLHCLELHRDSRDSSEEAEQRRRVFWIAYLLDKDISLRTGKPFVQSDNDMDVHLPSLHPADNAGYLFHENGTNAINIFRLRVELSIIQSTVYQDLYSIQGMKSSDDEKNRRISMLDTELQLWMAGIPYTIWPENMVATLLPTGILHMVNLYNIYFNCLSMIHCKTPGYSLNVTQLTLTPISFRPVMPSEETSLSAARTILRLMRYFPQGDYAVVWYVTFLFLLYR